MSKTQRLREQLYLLQGSRCFYCDKAIAPDERSLEHVIPSCEGGLADSNNAVVVCEAANQLLGAATPKQKMIMLKAGSGKIECPKKCVVDPGCEGTYGDEQKQARAASQQISQQRNQAQRQNQKTANQNSLKTPVKMAQTDTQEQTPMTAKQKHKARSGHQSMPRPASDRRRR